ncbi:MAG: hypothetical protein HYU66_27480 [Armatimonadetes bacterium]|nr:hypothetical protein [Armatimonadota bacterium]
MPRALVLLALLPLAALADDAERNLIGNPGFEQPAAANAYAGWTFVDHGQAFARGEIEAVEYHTGLAAASIRITEQPRVYVCWAQHVKVTDDAQRPNHLSVWYRAPDQDAQAVLSFIGIEDGKGVQKGNRGITLPAARSWTQFEAELDVPAGTRDVLVELRAAHAGTWYFDDLALLRPEPDTSGGKPDRLLFVGLEREALPDMWKDALRDAGYPKLAFETWDNLTPDVLGRARAVLLVGLPERLEVLPEDEAVADLLLAYVQAGGGVMLTQQADQVLSFMTLPQYLAGRLGTRILWEKLTPVKELTKNISPWGTDTFSFTDQVAGPWGEGVRGVLYPAAVDLESYCGVLPFLPAEGWTTTLSAGKGTHTDPELRGLDEIDRFSRPQGFADNVPLAGCRELGNGRAAYVGLRSYIVFSRPVMSDDDKQVLDTYLRTGTDGRPSDLLKWYLNGLGWLTAHADAVATASLQKRAVPPNPQTTAWKLHRGAIGPRTAYSTGQSTPDEYVAAAKAAGLDFIVFLDDLAELKPGGWEALRKDCRRLSDAAFLALPGVTYQNDEGNHEYAFGRYLSLPSQRLLAAGGKRLSTRTPSVITDQTWLYGLLGFNNSSGWYDFAHNPYPAGDARDCNTMAVVTQAGGRVVDRAMPAYAYQARSGQFLQPIALHLMQSAAEMAEVSAGTAFVNVIGAEGIRQLDGMFNTRDGRCGRHLFPGEPSFGCTSVTNGPVIELTMPRGDTDAQGNPWNPVMTEWDLKLRVTSAVGLREVTLWDGDTLIRRFLSDGAKELAYEGSLGRERQKAIRVEAVDTAGHQAFGRDITCDNWLLRENQCADRNNQLLDSRQVRPDGSPSFVGYGGDTVMPDKGPWVGRVRPVGCFVFDKELGVGSMVYDGSPENHPQVFFNPYLMVNGERPPSMGWSRGVVAGQEGSPHVRPTRVVASGEALVAERVLDGVYPVDAQPVIHVWSTLFPVKPSQWLRTAARVSLYPIKPDGISAYLWDQEFELLHEVAVKAEQPFVASLGAALAFSAKERRIVCGGKVVDEGPVAGKPVQVWPFEPGDWLGLLNSLFGSFAAFSLEPGLVLSGDGVNYEVGIKAAPGVLPAGTKLRARVLLVGMHRKAADPAALAARVVADYGLAAAPTYRIDARRGKVLEQRYLLRLEAESSAFAGTLRGTAALAGNLGATVAGLNDHWSAVYQLQGAAPKTRLIPAEQGVGYVCLRGEEDGQPVAVGHPFVCDNPDIVLSLTRTKDWKAWRLEVHNPTDREVRTRVRGNGFAGFTLEETVTVGAGASVVKAL